MKTSKGRKVETSKETHGLQSVGVTSGGGYSFREPTIAERLQIDGVLAQVPPPAHAIYAALRLCITHWPPECAGPAHLEHHLTPAQALSLLRETFTETHAPSKPDV